MTNKGTPAQWSWLEALFLRVLKSRDWSLAKGVQARKGRESCGFQLRNWSNYIESNVNRFLGGACLLTSSWLEIRTWLIIMPCEVKPSYKFSILRPQTKVLPSISPESVKSSCCISTHRIYLCCNTYLW